jgi:alpha-tubulin suppressor-like RCC1 family protein
LAFKPGLQVKQCITSGDTGFNAVIDMEGRIHVRGGNDTVEQRYPERSVLIPGGVPGVLLNPEGLFEEKPNTTVQTVLRSDLDISLIAASTIELGFVKADGTVLLWRSESTDLHFVPRHLFGVDLFALGPTNCIARNGVGKYIGWGQKNAILDIPESLDAKKIVIGVQACLAIQQDDTLLMWGYDLPVELVGKTFRDIAVCGVRFAAVSTDGTIHMWGHPDQPAVYRGSLGATTISIGTNHYVAVLENNDVLCWGASNEYKQLSVPSGLKAKMVCCGSRFTVALTMENRLVAWGWPKACVRIPDDVQVSSFVCGNDFVLAKLADATGYVI